MSINWTAIGRGLGKLFAWAASHPDVINGAIQGITLVQAAKAQAKAAAEAAPIPNQGFLGETTAPVPAPAPPEPPAGDARP